MMLSNKNLGHSDNRTSRAADPVLRPLKPVGGATGAVGPAFARTERGSTPAASSADGEGSSYAPALSHVLKTMNYPDFANVVVNGRKNVNTAQESVMPSFGTNPNVMCYIEDIFVYLRARANDAIARGRPQKHEDKPEATTQAENSCLGHKG